LARGRKREQQRSREMRRSSLSERRKIGRLPIVETTLMKEQRRKRWVRSLQLSWEGELC
jgi:hypothetical protein